MDGVALSQDKIDKLRQFQEVTQVEDTEMAIVTLTSLDWNVERAIEARLSDDMPGMASSSMDVDPVVLPRQRNTSEGSGHSSRRTRTPEAEVVIPNVLSSRSSNGFAIDVDTDDDDFPFTMNPRHGHSRSGSDSGISSNDNSLPLIPTECENAIDGTQNFQSVFEARYGQNGRSHLMPPFFVGSLSAAMKESFECPERPVADRKPLAIYLHHDKAVGRNIFANTVLCNESVINLLRMQFVLWPWDVTAKENELKAINWFGENGLQDVRSMVLRYLQDADKFPLLLLLSKEEGTVHLVDVCKGVDPVDTVMEKLLRTVEVFAHVRKSAEIKQAERMEREMIRQEQKQEYEKSLAADKERVEKKEREEREAREAEEAAKRVKEAEEQKRAKLAGALPSEPPEGQDAVAVRFRLPEGGELMRRFRKTEPLHVVLSYLESEGFGKDQYRMMNSDFPKKDVSTMDASSSLAFLKWPARERIYVEER